MQRLKTVLRWHEAHRQHLFGAVMFAITVGLLILKLPEPAGFISDPDWGHQLAGASQILRGQYPFADYDAYYGPLVFYASALGQRLAGTRVIGEILLVIIGYSVGYTLLFELIYAINRNLLLAGLLGIILVLNVPRLYKYYVVLWPALILFLAWRYIDHPGHWTVRLLGFSVAITGLFRPDFGVYAGLSAILAVIITPAQTRRQRLAAVVELLVSTLATALPWLIWIGVQGGLRDYLYSSTVGAAQLNSGMSLPFPEFDTTDLFIRSNRFLMASAGIWLILAITLITLITDSQAANRRKMWVALSLAALCMIQSRSRADEPHLLQSIPLTFVPIGWLIGQTFSSYSARRLRLLPGTGAIASIIGVGLLFSLTWSPWSSAFRALPFSLDSRLDTWETYTFKRDAFLEYWAQHRPTPQLSAYAFVSACSTRQDSLIAWPYLLSAYYFIDRPFGTRQMGVWPGSYDTVEKQEEIIQGLTATPPPFFVYRPYRFNERVRGMEDFAPILYAFLTENYVPIHKFGTITVYVYHEQQTNYACAVPAG